MTDNLPAQKPEPSAAQKQRDRIDQFMGFLQDPSRNLPQLLSDSGIKPDHFLAVARRSISNNPDLLNCTPASLLKAFINCATDGLLPDGRQAAIVIYKNSQTQKKEAQYQSMYQGLLDVAHRSGNFLSIEARVVYEGDHFDYAMGDNPYIDHKPVPRAAGMSRKIVAAYAVAKTVNGGIYREVFDAEDIRKVNAVSRATKGPGKDWPEEMARKGPLRRMWKFLPKNDAMARIAEHRDAVPDDLIDLEATEVQPQRRTIRTGFAKPAPAQIEQTVTPTADIPMEMVDQDTGEVIDATASDQQGERNSTAEPALTSSGVASAGDSPSNQEREPGADGEGAAAHGRGTDNAGPDASSAAPELPDGYDIAAWADAVPAALGGFEDVAALDGWINDPETKVRLERLKQVDPAKWDALSGAAKARRLKLSRKK